MISIVIADDHRIFRQGLCNMLSEEDGIEISGEAGDSDSVVAIIKETKPDVAILDISMPGTPVLEIIGEIRAESPGTKVIFLAMNKTAATASKAIQKGAGGYILKDDAFEDLIYAIRTVQNGGTFISPSIAANMFNEQNNITEENNPLTEREREVLRHIALGLTNKEIGQKLFISVKTVETHRMRIMQKLDLHTIADLVKYAMTVGIL